MIKILSTELFIYCLLNVNCKVIPMQNLRVAWPCALEELRKIQEYVAKKTKIQDDLNYPLKVVTGVDLAFSGEEAIAAAVSLDYSTLEKVEDKIIQERLLFPYIPTYLSFREGAIAVRVVKSLQNPPDVLFLDSHGIAHPRFCGCATHVGVLLNIPTIGVAKRKLCGKVTKIPKEPGEWSYLKYKMRNVGAILLSKDGSRPIYVSPGNRITLITALEITKHFLRGYKLPEPIRQAHLLANKKLKTIQLKKPEDEKETR
ncbi:MAG: endonuclease V [Candidatus Hodarchaeota archaeon]